MVGENERTAVVATTATAFEAETIAAALRERGIEARVIGTAGNVVMGVPIADELGIKVLVFEHELAAARQALESIRSDARRIDWDQAEIGGDDLEAQNLLQYARAKRWMWTLVLVLAPAGLFVVSAGVLRGDPLIQTIGGVLLITAIVMAARGVWEGREGKDQ